MPVPFVDLRLQHRLLRDELNDVIQRVLDRADFVLGEDVGLLEDEFAAYCGTPHAVGTGSGLAALELALRALGVGEGHEVILPAHTFTATAAAVTFTGAVPVLVDVLPETYTLDVSQLEAAITPRTRAIIPVHLYGQPADMDPIMRIAEAHHLWVIEDACQAHGALYHDRRIGSFGHAAAFSFYPSKNLGACGDAGMVVTGDAAIAEAVRAMRNCGQRIRNQHELPPFNHRLDTLQAALLRVKLRHLDRWNDARRKLACLYCDLLDGSGVVLPAEVPGTTHVYHLFVIRTPRREALRAALQAQGIATAIHYPLPVHRQPFYARAPIRHGALPQAEALVGEILSLPMFPEMTADQVAEVAAAVRQAMQAPSS